LRARRGYTRRTGVDEAGTPPTGTIVPNRSTDREIDLLCTESATMSWLPSGVKGMPRRPALGGGPPGGIELQGKRVQLQVESIYVINVGEIDPLPRLIVEEKSEKSRLGIRLSTLQIWNDLRGCRAGGAGDDKRPLCPEAWAAIEW